MNRIPGSFRKSALLAFSLALVLSSILASRLQGQATEDLQNRFTQIQLDYEKQHAEDSEAGDKAALNHLLAATTDQIFEMADECDDPQLAVLMLNWVVDHNPGDQNTEKAIDILLLRYMDQPGIAELFDESTPLDTLQTARGISEDPKVLAVLGYLFALKTGDEEAREKTLLELQEKHGEVEYKGQPIAELVVGPLAELRLRIGRVAPDIVGPDTDEVEFKLSDYRGKVVVLDFWGNW